MNNSIRHAFRVRSLDVLRAILTLLLLTIFAPVGADPGNDNRAPDLGICQNLEPSGNKVAFHVYAEGVQIYRWEGTGWVFLVPDALLFADAGFQGAVGIHYAGPTWESVSGGKVAGAVVDRCTPEPNAIPWLLLRATFTEGPGIFHRVTHSSSG